jgi:hypothetical protein
MSPLTGAKLRSGLARRRRWPGAGLWLGLLAGLPSCSVADNLTFREIVTELDDIVAVDGPKEAQRLDFRRRAAVSSWYMRSPLTWPLRRPLAAMFGERAVAEIDNPVGHVRVLVVELPDEVGADLARAGAACVRLMLLAELDSGPGLRIAALDSMCRIAAQIRAPLLVAPGPELLLPLPDAERDVAKAAIQLGDPERRGDWTAEQRSSYHAGLRAVVARPLATWQDRVNLLADLLALFQAEPEDATREVVAEALRAAIARSIESVVLRWVQRRDREHLEVRLCAMQRARHHGGPAMVPWLLACMAAPAAEVSAGVPRFDPELQVRLRLIHWCGQLRGELATRQVRLAGAQAWEALAPVDYLAETVLGERPWLSPVLRPAAHALSLSLGRPRVDRNPEWVRAWFRERQESL